MLDSRIVSGNLVTAGGRWQVDIGIRDGEVAGWFDRGTAPEATCTVDATDLLVFPGVVDVRFHSHLELDGLHQDIGSGAAAAATGGVTTVIQIAAPDPQPLARRVRVDERLAHVDVACYGVTGETDADAQALADGGVVGFKMFLIGAGAIRQVPRLRVGDDATLSVGYVIITKRRSATWGSVSTHRHRCGATC